MRWAAIVARYGYLRVLGVVSVGCRASGGRSSTNGSGSSAGCPSEQVGERRLRVPDTAPQFVDEIGRHLDVSLRDQVRIEVPIAHCVFPRAGLHNTHESISGVDRSDRGISVARVDQQPSTGSEIPGAGLRSKAGVERDEQVEGGVRQAEIGGVVGADEIPGPFFSNRPSRATISSTPVESEKKRAARTSLSTYVTDEKANDAAMST